VLGRPARATLVAAGLVTLGVVGAACGDGGGDDASGITTALVTATTYATVPLRSTTTTRPTVAARDGDDGGRPANTELDRSVEQPYEIRSGDYILSIARKFDVPYQVLIAYNGWSDGANHALVPGESIRIPPAGYDPAAASAVGSAVGSTPAAAGGPTCPDGSPQETYEIRRGDTKGRVAARLDTTVAELDAANASTPRYPAFVVGIDILVPC
jgi:LysM repeat protein